MSRIGNKPINIPSGVTYEINNSVISFKGPQGSDKCEICEGISFKEESGEIILVNSNFDDKVLRAKHGLYRSLIANIVEGISKGFEKQLVITGVGYKAQQQGNDIQLNLGYSHPIVFKSPEGIKITVVDPTHIKVNGYSKQAVGQVAANIRELRPPEPYKGKGIKYSDETILRKAGKTGK
ncbi:MAG: 50S ribosomal protein L6 [Spirochaetes bacterium]|nr:50S ribosomal protein L6 [Spirochaetota bacterium]